MSLKKLLLLLVYVVLLAISEGDESIARISRMTIGILKTRHDKREGCRASLAKGKAGGAEEMRGGMLMFKAAILLATNAFPASNRVYRDVNTAAKLSIS